MAIIRDSMTDHVYQGTKQYGSYIQLFHNPVSRQKALDSLGGKHIINLSTGFNLRDTANVLLSQLERDATNPFLYRNYEPSSGHPLWIQSVLAYERIRSKFGYRLLPHNVVVTAGSCVSFHYFARFLAETEPSCEVIVPVPIYVGFGENFAPYGIPVVEVVSDRSPGMLPNIQEISEGISSQTKLIYSGPVNNPTGIIVSEKDARDLLYLAKERSMYLLWDETQITLAQTGINVPDIWAIAEELGAWDNLVTVSSLSKDRGIPGFRIGWVIGPAKLIQKFSEYNGNLYSMPSTLFTGLVMKDLLFRAMSLSNELGRSELEIYSDFMDFALSPLGLTEPSSPHVEYRFHQFLIPGFKRFLDGFVPAEKIMNEFQEFNKWLLDGSKLFGSNYEFVTRCLKLQHNELPHPLGGFNCFVHLAQLDRAKQHTFVENMFSQAGIEILPGPAFGLQPKHWEESLGFWARLTLSSSRSVMEEGLERLCAFIDVYSE